MERCLFRCEDGMPLLSDGSLLRIALTHNRVKFLEVAWALSLMSLKVINSMDVALMQEEGIFLKNLVCENPIGCPLIGEKDVVEQNKIVRLYKSQIKRLS